jgi:Zn-finger protein
MNLREGTMICCSEKLSSTQLEGFWECEHCFCPFFPNQKAHFENEKMVSEFKLTIS